MNLETDSDLFMVGLGLAAAFVVYTYYKKGLNAASAVGQTVANTVTAPAVDWAFSSSNPLSDNAADQNFMDAVNGVLVAKGGGTMNVNEWELARGYGPSVALLGPAADTKGNWFFTASFTDCVAAAVAAVEQYRDKSWN